MLVLKDCFRQSFSPVSRSRFPPPNSERLKNQRGRRLAERAIWRYFLQAKKCFTAAFALYWRRYEIRRRFHSL